MRLALASTVGAGPQQLVAGPQQDWLAAAAMLP
jgi:hypothetical protein